MPALAPVFGWYIVTILSILCSPRNVDENINSLVLKLTRNSSARLQVDYVATEKEGQMTY